MCPRRHSQRLSVEEAEGLNENEDHTSDATREAAAQTHRPGQGATGGHVSENSPHQRVLRSSHRRTVPALRPEQNHRIGAAGGLAPGEMPQEERGKAKSWVIVDIQEPLG